MKKFYPYMDTAQFKNVIKNVRDHCEYHNIPLPIIEYIGTTKIHGSNASFYIENGEIITQSRNRIITPDNDNMGFSKFINKRKEVILSWYKEYFGDDKVVVYGEWCGQGIQKGVGISLASQRFIIFALKRIIDDKEEYLKYANFGNHPLHKENIHWIEDFNKSYFIEIDFNNPELIQNRLIELTLEVENECPVAKELGYIGIGEGIVFKPNHNPLNKLDIEKLIFKTKGDKHSKSKVKKLVPIDTQKLETINELVEQLCTNGRLEQGIDYLKEMNKSIEIKNIGEYIKWVMCDINKEESDVIEAQEISMKKLNNILVLKIKQYFINYLKELDE